LTQMSMGMNLFVRKVTWAQRRNEGGARGALLPRAPNYSGGVEKS